MPFELSHGDILSSLTALYIVIEKIYKHLIRGDIFAKKAEIPQNIVTDANIHDKVTAILEDKKVITLDRCQVFHKEQKDELLSEVNKKLDSICLTNKAILRFLAKQCKNPEEFAQLIDIGDSK